MGQLISLRRVWLSIFIVLTLGVTGCGNDTNSDSDAPLNGGAPNNIIPIIPTTTATITQANPIVNLSGQVVVDFNGSPNVFGSQVTVSALNDDYLNIAASQVQDFLGIASLEEKTFEIIITDEPSGPVKISVISLNLSQQSNNIAPVLYTLSMGLASEDDGEGGMNSMSPIQTTRRIDDSLIAQIPSLAFEPYGDGRFVARVKLGFANIVEEASPPMAKMASEQTSQPAMREASVVQIPCPLIFPSSQSLVSNQRTNASCVETSRFNLLRNITGSRRHLGVDLRASSGTPVYVPANGRPVSRDSFTASRFQVLTASSCAAPQPCTTPANAFHRAGITLVLRYSTHRIRLLHLNGINSSMLDSSGDIDESKITMATSPVATTGGTGAGFGAPHLHYELAFPTPLSCNEKNANLCQQVWAQVDPFPYIATTLQLRPAGNGSYGYSYLEPGAQYTFALKAFDLNGAEISSQVGNARENGGMPPAAGSNARYDPSRFFCLSSSAPSLRFVSSSISQPGRSGNICVSWGAEIAATGVAYQPVAEVTGRFTIDPTQPISVDPLSTAFAKASVITPVNFCIDRPILLVQVGSTCSGYMLAGCNSVEVKYITATVSNPAVVQAKVVAIQDDKPSFCGVVLTAGETAGDATVNLSYSRGTISAGTYFIKNLALR